jgi:hypothetical protein
VIDSTARAGTTSIRRSPPAGYRIRAPEARGRLGTPALRGHALHAARIRRCSPRACPRRRASTASAAGTRAHTHFAWSAHATSRCRRSGTSPPPPVCASRRSACPSPIRPIRSRA